MSTLAEIESAIEQLPEAEIEELRIWFSRREAKPAVVKWRGQGTGVVNKMGGVDAYLRQVREKDDDCG